MNEEPRILIYDIENSQTLVKGWGPMHDFSVTSIVEDFYILSYAHKWHGEPNTAIRFERKAARRGDDKTLMRKLWKLYDQADAVMAYNGDSFDQKKAWTRMSYHDLGPCSPYIELDPLKMMRQKFKLTSNKLDFVAKYYGIGAKLPHQGLHTWDGCEDNDPEAWEVMERYNKHDVALLDGVYERIAPYVRTRLNMQAWTGTFTCVKCGSRNLEGRGYASRGGTDKSHRQWRCLEPECGKYSYELLSETGRMRSV